MATHLSWRPANRDTWTQLRYSFRSELICTYQSCSKAAWRESGMRLQSCCLYGCLIYCYVYSLIVLHMQQSWVEIEHYSVTYFNRVTTFEALQCRTSIEGGAHTLHRLVKYSCIQEHVSVPWMEVLCYSASNAVNAIKMRNKIMFGFYPRLPDTFTCTETSSVTIHDLIGM